MIAFSMKKSFSPRPTEEAFEPNLSSPRKFRPGLLPRYLTGLGIVIFLTSAILILSSSSLKTAGSASIPNQVSGLHLRSSLSGPAAVQEISRLHGKDFSFSGGAVGNYGSQREATLWVSATPLSYQAGRILSEMQDKIGEGRSPFQPVEERADGNRTVYVLDGMGQRHFYFRSKNLVIWLAVQPELAERALSDVLAFYP